MTSLLVPVAAALLFTSVQAANPTVKLDNATFQGFTSGNVNSYLGIPFAEPPVGNLRFQLPVPIAYPVGTFDATSFGPSCPQQSIHLPLPDLGLSTDVINALTDLVFRVIEPDSEDCLTINVITPGHIPSGTKLSVVVWIFGGGFEFGGSSTYDGNVIVQRSIDLGEPVVYVSMNYRVSLFGFLASQEVKDAGVGNLGLHDQRQALRWVQKYISQFGGDPTKVTISGESAGAISVSLQMLTNGGNTEGLFRGAFMQSGSPIPVGDITHGQKFYDAVVREVGCASSVDTLACLRTIPYETLHAAMDSSPGIFSFQSLDLTWLPRTDGVFLTDNPQALVAEGSVARIPIVTGDCDDEGTIFSLANLNVTTEQDVRQYINTIYVPTGTADEINGLLAVYPADITQGSPFGTSILNALTPEFKRLAAIQGDLVFQAPRRYFINQISGKQDIWVFLNKRLKLTPFLGSFHGSDLLNTYGGGELTSYLVNFANHLDPNSADVFNWPKWDPSLRRLLTFQDGLFPLSVGDDTYRDNSMNFVINLTLQHPI